MKRPLSLLLIAALASACASVQKAPPEMDRAAKEFRVTPGKANLYVFRDESLGFAVKMSVTLDGRAFGDTAAKTFLLTAIDPGPHTLVSQAENDARLYFVAEPGTNLFVWQEVKVGFVIARSKLHLVDEASARPRVRECTLSAGELPLPPLAPPPPPSAPVPGA